MLLTKLEIKGFKSFGDKVVFNFDEGVTGVVGPNGSGKSNVVDSIRWVLGEQKTRSLRSEKMENVIFNGTKNRKPLQMAEASMTFKNTKNLLPTEYSEVTITRRYYRSGESEYLLNGVTCRLKDITNLFMDTGIGPDSYAIIELKMVDEILNDQNNSRRGLFEEAAGISKFKKRKKETLKKLADTDADLERVEDLLHEIGKNMRSLERQAKQAERFLKTKEQYKELALQLAVKSVSSQVDTIVRLNKQLETEKDKKLSLAKQTAELDAKIESQKAALLKQEKLLASRQKTLNDHVNKIRTFESDKKIKNERLKYLNDKSQSLQKQLDEDVKSNDRAKFSLEGLEKEHIQLEKIFRETEYVLEELRKAYEDQKGKSTHLRTGVEELSTQIKSKQQALYQLKKTLEISQVQKNSLQQELEREATDTSARSANMAEFDGKITELEQELSSKKERLAVLEENQIQTESRIASLEASLKSLQEELAKTNRSLDAKRNEYNLTKSMVDNLEGYPQALKFLKKNTKWGKEAPLLSDIITCEEKYRVSIENYLESFLNYYVIDNEAHALEAVNLLSDSAKGKANFVLLNKLNDYKSKSTKQFENAIPAIQVVEFDEKYRRLAYFILEDVYIVTSNQDQLPADDAVTFITQNGKIIKRKYSISGGSVGLFEGKKIGRAKNIEKLDGKIKELERKKKGLVKLIEQEEKDITHLKANLSKAEITDLRNDINMLSQEFVAIKTKKEQFSTLLADSANKRESIMERLYELQEAIGTNTPKVAEEEDALVELENRLLDEREALDAQSELTSQKSGAFNQQNILFHQQSNKLESIEKEIEYKRNAYERGKARIENNQTDLKNTDAEILKLQDTVGDNEQLLLDLYEEKETIGEGVREVEKGYYDLRGQISETEKAVRELQHAEMGINQLLLELQSKVNETRMSISSVKERVSVEFEIDLEKYMAEHPDQSPIAVEMLREEVQKLKTKMDKMGPINHMAIEAYNEIKERNDFIVEQQADLAKAKDSLLTTIAEIDEVARINFMEAFHAIRENFIKVFRSLFTQEDSCDLTLVDPDDPLGSKIEIIARPKGKRPLTINQLSGGEKTLTATALLFSIYLLKPAPFCIFDEVDAPLDDANIDKFNNIIREFSKNSQFIIVTHNKRTMASTDVVYGVTMLEQGVSTVVPVDLRTIEMDEE
ncbi:MAG: chromosome segregation protein SMC [Flammeovirgaceae bacterium]